MPTRAGFPNHWTGDHEPFKTGLQKQWLSVHIPTCVNSRQVLVHEIPFV